MRQSPTCLLAYGIGKGILMKSRILIRRAVDSLALVSIAKIVSGFVVLTCPLGRADAEMDWARDLSQAVEYAKQTDDLIMVVDLPTSDLDGDPTSLANDAFLYGTIGSSRLAAILRRNCIPIRRSVGVPPIMRRQPRKSTLSSPPVRERPVTYFCTVDPDTGQAMVVHFVVGYVAADRLENVASWAVETHRQATGEANADTNPTEWRQIAHLDACDETDVKTVKSAANLLRNSKTDLDANNATDVRNVFKALVRFRERRVSEQLGKSLSEPPDKSSLHNVSSDGTLDVGHIALALLPDVFLANIEQHCYELLAEGQCFSEETPRVRTLDAFLAGCARQERPVLCLVHEFAPRGDRDLGPLTRHQQYLTNSKVKRRLSNVEVVPVLQSELSAVRKRRRKPPIKIESDGTLLFALFDKRGKLHGTIDSDEPLPVTIVQRLKELE